MCYLVRSCVWHRTSRLPDFDLEQRNARCRLPNSITFLLQSGDPDAEVGRCGQLTRRRTYTRLPYAAMCGVQMQVQECRHRSHQLQACSYRFTAIEWRKKAELQSRDLRNSLPRPRCPLRVRCELCEPSFLALAGSVPGGKSESRGRKICACRVASSTVYRGHHRTCHRRLDSTLTRQLTWISRYVCILDTAPNRCLALLAKAPVQGPVRKYSTLSVSESASTEEKGQVQSNVCLLCYAALRAMPLESPVCREAA